MGLHRRFVPDCKARSSERLWGPRLPVVAVCSGPARSISPTDVEHQPAQHSKRLDTESQHWAVVV